ncbi:hypothetical protein PH235_09595 [Trichococcus sp. K1Tr]|uniref:hypothetical protein n=1 Tax=Trichococcus sp. K1Tr TaxID=3020847 RepID=UPI00232AE6FE|nr:hypothetical protein [Trichococcus sp. K1Tr]MDB6353812.1 hypothetical protein [Trichococcus sp. K1Tr]
MRKNRTSGRRHLMGLSDNAEESDKRQASSYGVVRLCGRVGQAAGVILWGCPIMWKNRTSGRRRLMGLSDNVEESDKRQASSYGVVRLCGRVGQAAGVVLWGCPIMWKNRTTRAL